MRKNTLHVTTDRRSHLAAAAISFSVLTGDLAAAAPDARVPRARPDAAQALQAQPAEATAQIAPIEQAPAAPSASTDAPAVALPPTEARSAAEPSEAAATETVGFRLPRARPELAKGQLAKLVDNLFNFGFVPDLQMRAAISAFDAGRFGSARALAADHADPVAAKLIDWMVAREPESGMSAAEIIKVIKSHRGWPEMERLRLQAERAFHATGPDNAAVLDFYTKAKPRSIGGRLALAGAIRDAGRAEEAAQIAREIWREEQLSGGQARTIVTRFGMELTPDDHLYRFRKLVLTRRSGEAVAQAAFLADGHANLARAVIAVFNRSGNAAALLKSAAPKFSSDPLYVLARVRMLRREDKPVEAAGLLLRSKAESSVAGDTGAWWDERRDLSRDLLDAGKPDLAFQVVSGHRATSMPTAPTPRSMRAGMRCGS
jgi:soluble lytic murein transglycosylase